LWIYLKEEQSEKLEKQRVAFQHFLKVKKIYERLEVENFFLNNNEILLFDI
jgi:hypothetical protein